MLLRIIKYIGILCLFVSYGALITNYVIYDGHEYYTIYFNIAWITGILSVIFNGVYAIKTDVSDLLLSTYGLCALFWFAPFFSELDSSYGIPSLIGFVIVVGVIHFRPSSNINKK